MSDQPDTLMLVSLRRIDANVAEIKEDLRDVKRRVTSLDIAAAESNTNYAGLQLRVDRMDVRLERIKRRLDLQDA